MLKAAEEREIYETELVRKRAMEAMKFVLVDNSSPESDALNAGIKKDNFAMRSMR